MTVNDMSNSIVLVQEDAQGPVLVCDEGLSFWGGVDPDTGQIIDAHHPQAGQSLAGRIVLMPGSRGSCSGSGVLLELARNGQGPAALVFRESESILTLGAIIAERLFDAPLAVIRLTDNDYAALSKASECRLAAGVLSFGERRLVLAYPETQALRLEPSDQAFLDNEHGEAARIAMEVLCLMAIAQGADRFTSVSRGHIDGCILAHDANLDFAEKMHELGARTIIPTTINAISVDRENWQNQQVPQDFGAKASRLADAYVKMGARSTFTCAPYLLDEVPAQDEDIGWSESNAVIYANSVIGARTEKHPDYLDLFIAMTGRAPLMGVYKDENRLPDRIIEVSAPDHVDDAFWPMLGWLAGSKSPQGIPVIRGVERLEASSDDLRALCAAFGTTSASPLVHVHGHTPEGHLPPKEGAETFRLGLPDFAALWASFNTGGEQVDLVAIGSPHASFGECQAFAKALDGQKRAEGTATIITVGRTVLKQCDDAGVLTTLQDAGVRVIPDLCWCSITEPILPPAAKVLMTNSGKYAHYAHGLTARDVRFGSIEHCAQTALTGRAPAQPPRWMTA